MYLVQILVKQQVLVPDECGGGSVKNGRNTSLFACF